MLLLLLVLFVAVPLLELAILLYLAKLTSVWHTLLLVVFTGVLGAALARRQGWKTYVRIQRELASGRVPTQSLLDAAMIFVAGAVLLTPGILTDLFGFSLLVPPCRRLYGQAITRWLRARFHIRSFTSHEVGARDEIIQSHVEQKASGPRQGDVPEE